MSRYLLAKSGDFLVVATPGAGKTTYALRTAKELMDEGAIEQIIVITPTEHLKTQWALAAAIHGIPLDPKFSASTGRVSSDYRGFAATYAGVATSPEVFRFRTMARPTLVILDEIHHAGDALSWGDAVRKAFAPAVRRLGLTGTPFRSDDNRIPFATYERLSDGTHRSVADFSYGYADALRDGVVRPVLFMAYSGETRWRTRAGDEISMRLGDITGAEYMQRAWHTALDPEGDWIPSVLRAAARRLGQIRDNGVPDAGGLVIASDQSDARAYAALLTELTGEVPTLVLSDDRGSSGRIAAFTGTDKRWIVAVRMVSEGVDIPRLGVLVYATNVSTPMFFAQAVGRVLRRRRAGETATVFLPSIPRLLVLASEMEAERDHVLGAPRDNDEWDELGPAIAAHDEDTDDEEPAFEKLGASAELDQVIFEGAAWGTGAEGGSDDEQDFLGIPGLLEPEQVTMLLKARQAEQVRRTATKRAAGPQPHAPESTRAPAQHEILADLRRELSTLVSVRFQRTGQKHALIHAELRRACGGPPTPLASSDQIKDRIAYLRRPTR